MDREAFKDRVAEYLARFNAHYTMLAKTEKGMMPVGMVLGLDQGYRFEPHAVWFPWASRRNILESSLNFLNKMRVTRLVILIIPQTQLPMFQHIERYGVIQRRGTVSRFFEDGQFGAIFQSKD